MQEIINDVAMRLDLPVGAVGATVRLLDDGATVPFISRYRKEMTGALSEVAVRDIESTLKAVRDLYARRDFVRGVIEGLGKMTPAISGRLESVRTLSELEDIYAPFKPKKHTRGTMARDRGLEPLAKMIMGRNDGDCRRMAEPFVGNKKISNVDDALAGASDIIAEWAADDSRLRNMARNQYWRNASLRCSPAKDMEQELMSSPYAQYADFTERVGRIPSHRYLAIRRAERQGLLKVRYELESPRKSMEEILADAYVPDYAKGLSALLIAGAVADSSRRLIRPSVENEISAALKEEADRVAIQIFADNLRQLLLAAPLQGRRVLAIDPGFRTGCKVVVLNESGDLVADSVIYPTVPRNDIEGARAILAEMIEEHRIDAIALGNGTASRETERFLHESGLIDSDSIFVVSEDGASVYSASDLARAEFPDKDITVRGAVSIGRRLIDPLAELVKIDPKAIGVGQYQHDVNQTELKNSLDYTVMSCVNAVGVNLNTASESLLQYVSGIGPGLAKNIVRRREAEGPFASRRDLLSVNRLGAKAFEQCAGFLRIPGGVEPLDNTGIHPESYRLVQQMAASVGAEVADMPGNNELLDSIDIAALADAGVGGYETMADIIAELRKPGRDPRQDDAAPFVPAIDSFEQLYIGMQLPGIVSNITAFGAFVNLGIHENGLLHISKICGRRLSSVSEVLHLGQLVDVEVIDIDPHRGRIGLALLTPV